MDLHFPVQNILIIINANFQLVMEGYKWHFNETVLTVWSAPNYCYRLENMSCCLGRENAWYCQNQVAVPISNEIYVYMIIIFRCGNVAAILELDEHLQVRNNILFLPDDTV